MIRAMIGMKSAASDGKIEKLVTVRGGRGWQIGILRLGARECLANHLSKQSLCASRANPSMKRSIVGGTTAFLTNCLSLGAYAFLR